MKIQFLTFNILLIFFLQVFAQSQKGKPPLAPVNPAEDIYFGKTVIDPYRYRENLKDMVVERWMKAQSDYAREVLNGIPGRQALIEKRKEFDNRQASYVNNLKITDNDVYFYLKNDSLRRNRKALHKERV